ncbi:carbamoyl-phosphate synthase (glutamine-hydrolyzing) large subunit [Microaerobacter geothermalis]|uniref:carbamoyl-phosphate synthase (glutamine-hydrolyzing) large subunit n=1 Tax=Microaerobacter geothermalis TaxID=674972 RepID=UPI001F2D3891|nr:carbamoyl-phosphate synthase (glutamine-hydrolyzing) large subunit [Microaerobacter geothermalis]MCF6093448.1 carbamoyl-phosphate synthase (glutamine-hydrolyzing) large subunit [Microaerobacter geothermalis]
MPKAEEIKKVLVIGSGPIVIGQAAEFDYAGTQACLAMKEERVEVVLVNNNPATIMTDREVADRIYMEPLTVESLARIIEKEKPDGILPTLGGQTGLNLAVQLADAGILDQYEVQLLGTPLETIKRGEDREQFKQMMQEIGEPVPESTIASSVEEALAFAEEIGYPVIVRPAYTLGGAGGGIAVDEEELYTIAKRGLQASPIRQVLVERSVKGWKEIEYEVMRDANDTCIIVCNMENIDPVGIHTGDSIVVAPSQTLTDRQYQMLRSVSCKVIRALGVVGGCNIQFALDPNSDNYYLIEVNPRVSRSSALASKATGYPIARISAKLALGYHLDEVMNPITGYTYASFEPAIDYVVVKIPRWPFDKFPQADRKLGTQMKATGEVMAIDRTMEGAILKGIRSLEIGLYHLEMPSLSKWSLEQLKKGLDEATDIRIFILAEVIRRGVSLKEIAEITKIDPYFLYIFHHIVEIEKELSETPWETFTRSEHHPLLKKAKLRGFADETIARLTGTEVKEVRELWKKWGWAPSYKLVDTCAAEFLASTPYYYSTWQGMDEVEVDKEKKKLLVVGSGPIRIGQGVEFDYCSVHAAKAIKEMGYISVVINNNPETVSTDYSTADQLYFEPLTPSDVMNVIEKEGVAGVFVQFGGQTAINLAKPLAEMGVHLYGTSMESIDMVEDREQFYSLLRTCGIPHIPGQGVYSEKETYEAANHIGYPILIRPSYVIGGQGMMVLRDRQELNQYFEQVRDEANYLKMFPLLVDKYMPGMEVEVDAVADGEDVLIPGIFEHVERAGVHSGDSTSIFPSPSLSDAQKATIARYTQQIVKELKAVGLINIQFVVHGEQIYVLEVNPRASRTVPIVSKVTGIPMVKLAVKTMLGVSLKEMNYGIGLLPAIPYFAVKIPIFSTVKLHGVEAAVGPDMKSTGEVLGLGWTMEEALYKAFHWKEGTVKPLSKGDMIFCSLNEGDREAFIPIIPLLMKWEVEVAATPGTASFLSEWGLTVKNVLNNVTEMKAYFLQNQPKLILNTPRRGNQRTSQGFLLRQLALQLDIPCFTSLDTFKTYIKMGDVTITDLVETAGYLKEGRARRDEIVSH